MNQPRQQPPQQQPSCISTDPADNTTARINQALSTGGQNYVLSLCQSTTYYLENAIAFTGANQEISTVGYPVGDERALLIVLGSSSSTAIDGTCDACGGVKVRNIRVNGNRDLSSATSGGAAIQLGGNSGGQLLSHVAVYNPRGWACVQIAEGTSRTCRSATITDNVIGPCGVGDSEQLWADGISLACKASNVTNNLVNGATGSGISLLSATGSQVWNNTISAREHTQRAGVSMVTYLPFNGDYTGTVAFNNTILGGFADTVGANSTTLGQNSKGIITKIGFALGPRIWDGSRFGSSNQVTSGVVRDNILSGAFAYGIAIATADNFTVKDNTYRNNYTFIGTSVCDTRIPSPQAYLKDNGTTNILTTDDTFVGMSLQEGDSLVDCITPPPSNSDLWPYAPPSAASPIATQPYGGTHVTPEGPPRTEKQKIIIGVTVPVAVIIFFLSVWAIRRWAVHKYLMRRISMASQRLSSLF
ncbi:hypothetical protein DL96DRAFT_1247952 [Flagelloscypha sp. PMI_526]|nr:hypothetical protein DL96DRAFT_1247952 [Flagelloscypha sp. PMI_526]